MKLTDLLTQKKAMIVGRWVQKVFDSYPPETAIFLKKEKDHFDNPVGHRLADGLAGIFATLLEDMDREKVLGYLDEVIQVRAVQQFSPAQALAFIFLLKNVIREELAKEIQAENLAEELLDLESCIDGLALLGFDVYTKRREKLQEVKVQEIKNRVSGLLRKSGIDLGDL